MVSEDGESVVQVRWAEVFGIEGEPSLEEIRSRGMVSEDGVPPPHYKGFWTNGCPFVPQDGGRRHGGPGG